MSKMKSSTKDYNLIGQKIKLLRTKYGMSQYDLANALNCSREKIYHYEAGLQRPDFYFIEAIAQYYNVSIDYFSTTEREDSEDDDRKAS